MPKTKTVSARDVRAWGQRKGLASNTGRLSNQTIAAFNKAHPRNKYATA